MERISRSTSRVNGHVAASTEQWRPAPYNLEAEQALLGAILLKNEVYDRVSRFLPATDFYDPLHQQIYATAGQLITAGAAATPITMRAFF